MAEAQNNIPMLNRKEWQTMMPAPTATAAGCFVVSDNANTQRFSLYVNTAAICYLYDHDHDDWLPITASGLVPAIAAGACGCFTDWSMPFIANGGSTTTITVLASTYNINGLVVGKTVEFTSGANIGIRKTIDSILFTNSAGNITLTFTGAITAVANNDTFRIASGSFWVLSTGAITTTSFKQFDIATMQWIAKAITGLPAWGTDGRLCHPGMFGVAYETVTDADVASDTTIGKTTKTWTADQWINYQMRITGGTGIGQIRVITDSDATTLTVASMNPDPDATSDFVIEGDEDAIYAAGNNAKILYKYSIIGGTWATVSVSPARTNNAVAGMSLDFVGVTGDAGWANVNDIKDGRYFYSLDGLTSVLERYDLALKGWAVITYLPALTTFNAGASSDWDKDHIVFAKEGTAAIPQRFYKYDLIGNVMHAFNTDWYLGGAALIGNKIWVKNLSSTGLIKWLYCLQSTSAVLRRIMIY